MHDSFAQTARKILDAPLEKKGIFFYSFFPFFLLISVLIAWVAHLRRVRSYAVKSDLHLNQNKKIEVICVGNVLIGGSGKTPIVQFLAKKYLLQGKCVGIASRGITKSKKPIYVSSVDPNQDELNQLSDENREHYEILKSLFPKKSFFILQNKNRSEALSFFSHQIPSLQEAVLLLDDGLQHFECPRDKNFCVWDPDLLFNAPPFAMPIGPYREGFGRVSLRNLLNGFDLRIWSRTTAESRLLFVSSVKQALDKYECALDSKKDMMATYQIKQWPLQAKTDHRLEELTSLSVLCGIARPHAFVSDLKKACPNVQTISTCFLNDHAVLTQKAYEFIDDNHFIALTTKDYFRWNQDLEFKKRISGKNIFVFFVEIDLHQLGSGI